MKVAIIHYWLVGMRGGEKVLEAMCELYPPADISRTLASRRPSRKKSIATGYSDVHHHASARGIDVQDVSAPNAAGARAA